MKNFIVAYTISKNNSSYKDHYRIFTGDNSEIDAQKFYDEVLKMDYLYTASKSIIMESTDAHASDVRIIDNKTNQIEPTQTDYYILVGERACMAYDNSDWEEVAKEINDGGGELFGWDIKTSLDELLEQIDGWVSVYSISKDDADSINAELDKLEK